MLLQTNSYVVPREKRAEHARLLRRFRSTLAKLGCDQFEAFEQVGANWNGNETTGRYVQIMRFRDRKHQLQVQQAERNSPAAQQVIAEFCRLINFPYQQQQGLFAIGYYTAVLPDLSARARTAPAAPEPFGGMAEAAEAAASGAPFGTSFHPAEEAPGPEEEAVEETAHAEEELTATAVEYVEESYPSPEALPVEEARPSDDGQAAGAIDEALDAADVADAAYESAAVQEEPVEAPPPAPVAKSHPAPAVVPPPPAPTAVVSPPPPAPAPLAPAPVVTPEPRRGLRPRKPIASAPSAPPVPPPTPAPAPAPARAPEARAREVWSDDYTAPQGTTAPQAPAIVQPAPQPAVAKPSTPAEAARGNGAATAPAFKKTTEETVPAFTPKVPGPEVPAAPSAADDPPVMLPDAEPISAEVELPAETPATQADASMGLDLIEEGADEQDLIEAPDVAEAPVIAETPVVAESARPVVSLVPPAPADAPLPPPLPVVRDEQAPAVVEPRQQEAVGPAILENEDELRLDETPLAFEPGAVLAEPAEPTEPAEAEFAWPDEVTEAPAAPAAAHAQPVEEVPVHEPAAAGVEFVKDEPVADGPAAITTAAPAPAQPPSPARPPSDAIASELEPEPLRFAQEQPAHPAPKPQPLAERPGGGSDFGLLALESHDATLAEADNNPFESLADALEVSDDELDVSDVPAAAQPARTAGSNGNGALSVTSAAKKSAAAFTDEDIDAALNEALRHLDGLDDLPETTVPSRSRAAAR